MKKLFKKRLVVDAPYGQQGFSLVEVLIAVFILALIAMAFIPLFAGSIAQIYQSGYRSQAISAAAAEVEERLLQQDTIDTFVFEMDFGGETVEVPGGLVEVEQSIHDTSSELTAVLPLVPTISIIPSRLVEGYKTVQVEVVGYNTEFDASSTITITGKDGITSNILHKTVHDGTSATFTLSPGLTNANSPYIIAVITGDEVAKARLQVDLPYFVAVGSGGRVVVSPDGEVWRFSATSSVPTTRNLNDISWNGALYAAVGDGRTVMTLLNREGWLPRMSEINYYNHNGLAWGYSQFVAVGTYSWWDIDYFTHARVMTSPTGTTWSAVDLSNMYYNFPLNDVAYGEIAFVAVGKNGTVIRSSSGQNWTKITVPTTSDLNAVTWSPALGLFVAVGNNGTIMTSPTGETWQVADQINGGIPSVHLNGITAGASKLIAVGNNGLILTSIDGINWERQVYEDKIYHLQDVCSGRPAEAELFVAVGNSGTIFTSPDGVAWTKKNILNPGNDSTATTSVTLNGISSRW